MEALVVVFSCVLVFAILGGALVFNSRARARRGQILFEALAPQDGAVTVDPKSGAAACTFRGLSVGFRFTTRGSGSSAESWTEADVDVRVGPLTLSIRPQQARHAKLVKQGLALDLELGNPLLDAKYLIEGAPAAIVKRVLTPEVQRKLLALDVNEIDTTSSGIQVARRGWREDPADVQAFVDLAVSIAENIAPATAEVNSAEAPQPASAYRGSAVSAEDQQKWQEAKREVAARQAAEVAALEQVRARRAAFVRSRQIAIGVAAAVIFLFFCAFALIK